MKRRWLTLAAVLLAGCAHYRPAPLDAAKGAERFEQRTLGCEGLHRFVQTNLRRDLPAWPPPRWNLELLTLAAYYFQPSLDVARAQWRVAEAAARSAGARPNPTVSFAPGLTANSPAGVTPWLMAAGFDWPVETAGKRGLRIAQAKQLACAARFSLLTTAWQVRASVRASLAAGRFAGNQVALLEQQVALQQQIVAKLEGRQEVGALAQAEVTPAWVALEKLKAELGRARENAAAAAARLAGAIGISLRALTNAPRELTLSTPQLSEAQITAAKASALRQRSDLLAALAEYDAAETALRLEIAKQYPDLHFNPNYEYDQGANKWRLGVSLELPVLNRNQGPIAKAKAKRDEAVARFTALQAKVIAEIDAAAQAFQRARQRHLDLQPGLAAELKHEQDIEAQVRAGAAEALDLLAVKLERLNGLALDNEAGSRAEQAFGQLEDALQQLLERREGVLAETPPEHLESNPRERTSPP